ncbi:MAG: ABC transporter permease, partial [Solirubrobacteraceae bacterium]
YQNDLPVKQELIERLPATVSLTAGAAVIWIAAGVLIGTIAAVRPHSLFDRLAMGGALVAISAPVFWVALLSLFLFADVIGKLHVFPGAGSYVPISEDPVRWLESLILPWLVLAASLSAIYARLLRANLIDTMSEDYIRTARAKGLRERRVIARHGLPVAITPVLTAAGLDIGLLLSGAILVEAPFNIPGIGRLLYVAILNGDLPMIQGAVLLGGVFIIVANIVVDVLYAYLDPRVRFA